MTSGKGKKGWADRNRKKGQRSEIEKTKGPGKKTTQKITTHSQRRKQKRWVIQERILQFTAHHRHLMVTCNITALCPWCIQALQAFDLRNSQDMGTWSAPPTQLTWPLPCLNTLTKSWL